MQVRKLFRGYRARRVLVQTGAYLLCSGITLLVVVPLLVTIVGGFKSTPDLLTRPFGWPDPVLWSNYADILSSSTFWRQLWNSVVVGLATTLGVVVFAAMPAFIFARLSFRGRGALFTVFTLGLLFPLAVAMLPLYITLRRLGLLDSLLGVVLPQIAFGLPSSIVILCSFFRAVPSELEEAAVIDGCSAFGFFWRVLLPLTRSGLAAVAVLTMVASWNSFFLPLLVLNDAHLWTLPLGVMQFQGQYGTEWGRVMAFVTLSLLPAVVFYLLVERYLVVGVTASTPDSERSSSKKAAPHP